MICLISFTDDPIRDWDRHCDEEAAQETRLPRCDCCKERIYEDSLFDIDGEILCEDCMNNRYRRDTDDYMEEMEW